MSETLDAARILFDQGFGVHLLHPKSKAPIGLGWGKNPQRKKWSELEESFKGGMNIGVRLGTPSQILVDKRAYFLAVIDCDCKSKDPEHTKEMLRAVKKNFSNLIAAKGPRVRTGRGGGSAHFYVLTRKPAAFKRLAQSKDSVKVKIPSVKPSGNDRTQLTKKEVDAGWRIRPAWEVSIMGEGQQVVAPPSVHPDTGRAYEWCHPPGGTRQIPILTTSEALFLKTSRREKAGDSRKPFLETPVDYLETDLDQATVALITHGKGCDGDRSTSLFKATLDMIRAGLSDAQIETELTDRGNYLGDVAFQHRQTTSRQSAVNWFRNYTLAKAHAELDASKDFENAAIIEPLKTKKEIKAQKEKMFPVGDWRAEIDRVDGDAKKPPKSSVKNVATILRGKFGEHIFRKNLLNSFQEYGVSTPWGGIAGTEVPDEHLSLIQNYFAKKWRFEPGLDKINGAITVCAAEAQYHPVRDYLNGLKWDGTPRIDTWLKRYLGAKGPNAYVRAVSRKVLVAMAARVFEPGKKFDQVVILEGKQGVGKSTALKYLASERWFSDAHIDVTDKDGVLAVNGIWLAELGELSALNNVSVNQLKDFISRTSDRIRRPYGRRVETFPRQCVFIGTTNKDEYLKDTTGNRRFWPVKVYECDFEAVKRDRDQLFAEAVIRYRAGEPLYMETEELNQMAENAANAKLITDAWESLILRGFEEDAKKKESERLFPESGFQLLDLFHPSDGPLKDFKCNMGEQKRAADILRKFSWKKVDRKVNGTGHKFWVKKDINVVAPGRPRSPVGRP